MTDESRMPPAPAATETPGPYASPGEGAPAKRELSPASLQAILVFSFFAFLTFACSGLGTIGLVEYQVSPRADYYSTSIGLAFTLCGLLVIVCVAGVLAFVTRLRRSYATLAILAFVAVLTLGFLKEKHVVWKPPGNLPGNASTLEPIPATGSGASRSETR